MNFLNKIFRSKKQEEKELDPVSVAIEKTNKKINNRWEGKPRVKKASKIKPKVKAKQKSTKKKKSGISTMKKFLEKETSKGMPMVHSIFRDEAGELCVRSTIPTNMMSREQNIQFQREAVLALLNFASAKKTASKKK